VVEDTANTFVERVAIAPSTHLRREKAGRPAEDLKHTHLGIIDQKDVAIAIWFDYKRE
jgi:hypothetical protein